MTIIIYLLIFTILGSPIDGMLEGVDRKRELSCTNRIYCKGRLLHAVQTAGIYPDSKTFVDKRLRNPVKVTLANFAALLNATNNEPSKEQIARFVDDNFVDGGEMEIFTLPDYTENPDFLNHIDTLKHKDFAQALVKMWPTLARKIKREVADNPELFSLIPVDNGFIIPGGRFKEFYYWDSYWIIRGLLISGMNKTVRGMLDNFVSMVERFGFIPNGARVYYLDRSQPPMLTSMVTSYIEETDDKRWLARNIHLLDKELRFWLYMKTTKFRLNQKKYTLAYYSANSGTPRPESYLEDIATASMYHEDEEAKMQVYDDLKGGAESGWDFSSRWIFDHPSKNSNLSYIQTHRVIPVDLNAFLCKAFRELGFLYEKLGDLANSQFWLKKAAIWRRTINEVLYDHSDGIWYDYDRRTGTLRKMFYPSNFAPLWAKCYDYENRLSFGERAVDYFNKYDLSRFYGVPSSLSTTRQQWDFPNAWAPLQYMMIFGFEYTGNDKAQILARDIASKWIHTNLVGFENSSKMFEKYDADNVGRSGTGGEYEVQDGFGWTNGVMIELIKYFYNKDQYLQFIDNY